MRLPVEAAAAIALATLLSAPAAQARPAPIPAAAPVTGPAADYPVVLGASMTIDGVTYTPVDTLNYDAVGYAELDPAGGEAITAAHRTLPLPSYVEVTALDSGKTALVRIERRGPMSGKGLIALSPGVLAQLGLPSDKPSAVRVRRVNPPEQERALLRSGERAPLRMETPPGLLAVLKRKLGDGAPVPLNGPSPQAVPTLAAPSAGIDHPRVAQPSIAPLAAPEPRKAPPAKVRTVKASVDEPTATKTPMVRASTPTPIHGGLVVQIAAFSARAHADAAAAKVHGSVVPAGKFWRLRTGPFATRTEAEAALAQARHEGYSDARIQRAD